MKKRINLASTTHIFEKQNLVTIMTEKVPHDIYKCSLCGLKGKRYGFVDYISIDGRSKADETCPKNTIDKECKIEIIDCGAFGKEFVHLVPGSIHELVLPPNDKQHLPGVWVSGVSEPVRLLPGEYRIVKTPPKSY